MKTAVILAARKERDSDIPYPICPFSEGQCLLDRTLQILRDEGYRRMLIVAGYQSELFLRYQSEDVTIVINDEYEFTSSMGSLAKVSGLIDEDFLLIEGDTFYEKDVIRRLGEISSGNCLVMTEESGSGDECFAETKSGFITGITKDRHRVRHFEGELLGILRVSLPTFRKVVSAWEQSENPYLNYEYLLMDVTDPIDRPVLFFPNLIWGEVDHQADFRKLENDVYPRLRRKEDPFDYANLLGYLSEIFPDEDVSVAVITKIGGMSNKNFRVELSGKSYVLRVPGNGSEGMVERANEEFNAREGSRLGVNPATYYFNSQTGVKLTEYVADAETLNCATIQRHDNMNKIASIYKAIHGAHIRLRNEFNIFQEIIKYENLLKDAGATMYPGHEEVRPEIISLESYLNILGVDLRPCHNDAVPENFIKSPEGTIYLIDWEYSGMNDPMADFAALFLESDFTEENQDYILQRYFGGSVPAHTREKILCYQILWDYLWALWTVIKEAKGDDFGSYGADRFNRARKNLELLDNTKNIWKKKD